MQQINIDEFVVLAGTQPVLDVRSPGEYGHAHIPGAYSLPLFTDEERKVVGTAYKQEGREVAIKIGLDYFGVKMRRMVEDVEALVSKHKRQPQSSAASDKRTVLLHCWRGGMRSAGVAWLLDLYGFRVYTLVGGYKAYRNWVLQQFEKPYSFNVLGGYTGSGKTEVLKEIAKTKRAVIDLEGIAHHKGSAYGALGEQQQPGQEMFENILAGELYKTVSTLQPEGPIWIEDESRRIGNVNLPDKLWETMQRSPLYFMQVPFEGRLEYITTEYGKFKQEELVNATMRIRKRLGGQNTKNAINYLLEGNNKECFRILLGYYDKYYERSLSEENKAGRKLRVIECGHVDAKSNAAKIVSEIH